MHKALRTNSNPLIISTIVFLTISINILSATVYANSSADWPLESNTPNRTRYSTSNTLDTGHLLWKSESLNYSSIIVADGRLYALKGLDTIQCLNASTGAILWSKLAVLMAPNSSWFSVLYPAFSNGRLYVSAKAGSESAQEYGTLFCLNASTGENIWKRPAEYPSYVTVTDNRLYLSSAEYAFSSAPLECLDAVTGSTMWVYDKLWMSQFPVVYNGAIYAVRLDMGGINEGICLNASDGTVIANTGAVMVADQGMLYSRYGVERGEGYTNTVVIECARNPFSYAEPSNYTWTSIWAYERQHLSYPSVAYGRIYMGYGSMTERMNPVAALNGTLCLNATDGKLLWNYSSSLAMGTPAVADGKVYVGSDDQKIYCLSAFTGAKIWSFTMDGPISQTGFHRAVPIIANGIVYAIGGGRIYAFGCQRTCISIRNEDSSLEVTVDSNSQISQLTFSQSTKSISFNAIGPTGRAAFCNVTFPKNLLGGPYTVLMNGSSVTETQRSNSSHTIIYFTYTHSSTHTVSIVGATVVPEFPTIVIQVLVLVMTSVCILLVKRKYTQVNAKSADNMLKRAHLCSSEL